MPELPEVERAARLVERAIVGRTIARVRVLHPAQRRHLSTADERTLAGAVVERVQRRAKYQLITTSRGVMLVHFRMNGDWRIDRVGDVLPPHARVVIDLSDDSRVSLVDSRALGSIALYATLDEVPLPELGPEATDSTLTPAALRDALRTRRGPIKPALLDQRVISGLGNIYAAEALWNAKVSPFAVANRLTLPRLARVIAGVRQALADADHTPGRYTDKEGAERLHAYDREGEPCERCGHAIRRRVQAGRSTYWCATCQRA